MKKTDVLVAEPKDDNLPEFISEENKHLFPEDMQFAFDYVRSKPIVFPKRYLRAQKRLLKREIDELYQEQSNLSIKIVLITLLQPLPDFIPSEMLGELCTYILDCWKEKIAAKS